MLDASHLFVKLARNEHTRATLMKVNSRSVKITKEWNMIAVRPRTGRSSVEQGRFLVAILDKAEAVREVQARVPDAEVTVESEASAELLKKHLVRPGEVFVLV
jgi:hypothetical protein